MVALLLLLGTMQASASHVAHVDALEINTFGVGESQRTQVLALDWCGDHRRYHVRAWAWHKGGLIRRRGDRYFLFWPGSGGRIVVADYLRRTRTVADPEIEDHRYRNPAWREPLWPARPSG